MVFGTDWDEPLTAEEMRGRAYTADELRKLEAVLLERAAGTEHEAEEAFAFLMDQLAYKSA